MENVYNYKRLLKNRDKKIINTIYRLPGRDEFIDNEFTFDKKLLDFGSSIESDNYKKTVGDGGEYFGFDIEEETVNWLKNNKFYVDFWETKEKFDIIVASEVYEHLNIETREDFIRRASQLLRPNGLLIVDFPHIYNLDGLLYYWEDRTHLFPPAPRDEALLIESCGLSAEIYVVGIAFWPPYRILRILLNILLGYHPQHTVFLISKKS